MKIKNLILGIASIVLAIGSVSASLSATAPEYIHIKYAGATTFVCSMLTIPTNCVSTIGPNDCVALIVENGITKPTPAYDNIFSPTTCTTRLKNSQPVVVTSSKQVIVDSDDL